ncbi:MAG TPA: DUF2339 domain-containing protein [Methylomirabilota bacterium]|nr:DUF2339 domain-containing protein [Methylomirabilota bacterium]
MIPLLLLLIAVSWVILLPLVMLNRISQNAAAIKELKRELDALRHQATQPGNTQTDLDKRIAPEQDQASSQPQPTYETPQHDPAELLAELRRAREQAAPPLITPQQPPQTFTPPPTISPALADEAEVRTVLEPAAPAEPSARFNMEQFLGAKLFAWVGGIALFFGVAFFIKYSFERNLIPPPLRVALGSLVGIALVVAGAITRHKAYKITSHTLCAAGILILYAAAFGAHHLYQLVSLKAAFAWMSVVTAVAFALAVRFDSKPVAVLALHGGFLTPLLLGTGEFNAPALFSYLGLLDIGIVGVALHRRWSFLPLIGALGTALYAAYWSADIAREETLGIGYLTHLGFVSLFAGALLAARRYGRLDHLWLGSFGAIAGACFFFALCTASSSWGINHLPSLYLFLFAVDALLLAAPLAHPQGRIIFDLGGSATFIILVIISRSLRDAQSLWPSLAAYLTFGGLHGILPSVMRRRGCVMTGARTAALFALSAFIFCFVPLTKFADVGGAFWVAVAGLNFILLAVCILAGLFPALIGGLLLTAALAGVWVGRLPTGAELPWLALAVIGLMGLFYSLLFNFGRRTRWFAPGNDGSGEVDLDEIEQLSAPISLLLPFLLLALCIGRFQLLNPSAVFSVGFALAQLSFVSALRTGAFRLAAVGAGAFVFLEAFWAFKQVNTLSMPAAFGWLLGSAAVIFGYAVVFLRHHPAFIFPWVAGALAFPTHFLIAYFIIAQRMLPSVGMIKPAAALAVVMAVPNILACFRALKVLPGGSAEFRAFVAWMGGGALFLLSVALPLQLERQWLTLGWAIEAVALLLLARRAPHRGLLYVSFGLLAAVFLRLAVNPAVLDYELGEGLPFLNWHLYTYGTAITCMIAAARLIEPLQPLAPTFNPRPALWSFVGILSFLLLNIQIADFFDSSRTITFDFRRNLAINMTYSIAWACFAFGLIAIGLVKGVRASRYTGIALTAVTVAKLFFLDLQNLDAIYRIAAFIGVAVVLIGASMLYQRFVPADSKANSSSAPKPSPTAGP